MGCVDGKYYLSPEQGPGGFLILNWRLHRLTGLETREGALPEYQGNFLVFQRSANYCDFLKQAQVAVDE